MEKRKAAGTLHDFFTKESRTKKKFDDIGGPSSHVNNGNENFASLFPSQEAETNVTEAIDIDSLERDPGKRKQIWEYPVNQRDDVRRAYIYLKAFQPHLTAYPKSGPEKHKRKFQFSWFSRFDWLEYSPEKDKAFCFPCFLFNKPSGHSKQITFTIDGFNNWRKVGGKDCSFIGHLGNMNAATPSPHWIAQSSFDDLRNQPQHIERVINRYTSEQIENNRIRIMASIKVVRLLASQGCSFRGHNESSTSLNQGNFLEFLEVLASENEKLAIARDNAPKNAKYTSHGIQKQILNLFSVRVRKVIREEIGNAKFCLLVDEARDESKKEQLSLVLRFVDNAGFIRERFFGLVHVHDTAAMTLKEAVYSLLSHYNLGVENIRGQGYDGASNMRGELNGLQALIMKDCAYAYYIHCFAHRLQLALVAASKNVIAVNHFFSKLTSIVNIVGVSCKRVEELKKGYAEEIAYLIEMGELETGRGLNQIGTLQRAGDTRWSSHLKSVSSLLKMFSPSCEVLLNIIDDRNSSQKAEAAAVYDIMTTFDFVFVLHLMKIIMEITDSLCQALQRKNQDILNAVQLVSSTKVLLQRLRDDEWDDLFAKVKSFCDKRNISIPDMSARFVDRRGRARNQIDNFTIEHHYQVDIFNAAIDSQLREINARFSDNALELLILSATLNPRDTSGILKISDICLLVEKFYSQDFTNDEKWRLEQQLQHYEINVVRSSHYKDLSSISELCQWLVKSGMSVSYNLVFRVIVLILTLPVSTATTERSFSAMNIVKTSIRSTMEDGYLTDAVMVYIEREIARSISNETIMQDFKEVKTRKVQF